MKIEYLPAETENWSIMKMQVNDLYWIEFTLSIEMDIWLSVREKGSMFYMLNWCGGGNWIVASTLVNCILHFIDTDDLQDLPRRFRTHPFWTDVEFRPYTKFCQRAFPGLDLKDISRECYYHLSLIPESPLNKLDQKITIIRL